ncbi:hypothetical protein [Listeria booriae]|uniref:Uncharacterized protein n=1 Tax=Listeria booriae TaxID=1552123 RepID=A0A842BEF0_9LIST|nr:hypothetical protein [Listeria booriae]MBC1292266.1 hypothetical protein [Listeria booriae]MBC1554261.1 hypothetical protein [Listeria booriae]MBC1898550.1 hypothetical protein [Listeria booriae]MBC2180323.1 hypothetical protein [Listeria booriae]MBC2241409.1 hypothetical protein [Listeria booriae]
MNISVFLSYPKPITKEQEYFIENISDFLRKNGLEPRTLGVTDYDMSAPLIAIRRLMLESNGIITIAFKRTKVIYGKYKLGTSSEIDIKDKWYTSAYCQIEPAMAFQIGLPILILREKGVIEEGILEKGVTGAYLPEFDLDLSGVSYLDTQEWNDIIKKWEGFVRTVYASKGNPPKLY